MTKVSIKAALLLVSVLFYVCAEAQTGDAYGAYSPYSVYGIGDLSKEGTAFNKSMGGVGIATRNRRFINVLNPASLSAIDSSSFMADFGVVQNNKIFSQTIDSQRYTSGNNTFNIANFVMAFPVYRSFAMMVGVTPFSDVGYEFSNTVKDQGIVGITNNITYNHYGEGSIYQLFIGGGVSFFDRLSVGAEMIYYFGTITKASGADFSDAAAQDVTAGSTMMARGITGKFGLQYEQPLGRNLFLGIGATYRLGTRVGGTNDIYRYADHSTVRDTINFTTVYNKGNFRFGDELGVGISLRSGDRWRLEVNYLRSDWSSSGFDNSSNTGLVNEAFSASVAQSFRAGFEIVPNRNDTRYYLRRWTYRAGIYYDQSYYRYDGNIVSSKGITFGVTLPVFRLYNGLTVGFDLGQKGSLADSMIRERYATINVSINIHDLWFHKPRYE